MEGKRAREDEALDETCPNVISGRRVRVEQKRDIKDSLKLVAVLWRL